jgi:hypothetical protein
VKHLLGGFADQARRDRIRALWGVLASDGYGRGFGRRHVDRDARRGERLMVDRSVKVAGVVRVMGESEVARSAGSGRAVARRADIK